MTDTRNATDIMIIKRDVDILNQELDRANIPQEKNGFIYSLWGRVSTIIDERNDLRARLASLEAARKQEGERVAELRKALEDATNNLHILYRNDATRWATMDVAENYAHALTRDFRALLASTAPEELKGEVSQFPRLAQLEAIAKEQNRIISGIEHVDGAEFNIRCELADIEYSMKDYAAYTSTHNSQP